MLIWLLFKAASRKWVFIISWEVFTLNRNSFEIQFLLDTISLRFIITVITITAATLLFSNSYIRSELYFVRFHLMILRFVISMKLLILSSSLISLLLGWDILGVTSFLLVVYYNNSKAFNAGILTILSNRVGDGLLLISLGLMVNSLRINLIIGSYLSHDYRLMITSLIIIAALTKRAQVPFSAWLPAAIAAPTPVSTLVHSSTLVTAGVYLLIRLRCSITSYVSYILLIIGLFTRIMARITALYEIDIKKIIALSTLSQLGLIMTAVGLGVYLIAYFHLLVHAFFKALLFITVGNIIHRRSDFQDLRKGNINSYKIIITRVRLVRRNLSLIGIPFFSSFYSKDLIVETNFIIYRNIILLILFLFSMALTVAYTFRFIFITIISYNKRLKVSWIEDTNIFSGLAIWILWPLRIIRGRSLLQILLPEAISPFLSLEIKILIILSLFFGGIISVTFKKIELGLNTFLYWRFGRIWAMPWVSGQAPLKIAYNISVVQFLDTTFIRKISFEIFVSRFNFLQRKVRTITSIKFKNFIILLLIIIMAFLI